MGPRDCEYKRGLYRQVGLGQLIIL